MPASHAVIGVLTSEPLCWDEDGVRIPPKNRAFTLRPGLKFDPAKPV